MKKNRIFIITITIFLFFLTSNVLASNIQFLPSNSKLIENTNIIPIIFSNRKDSLTIDKLQIEYPNINKFNGQDISQSNSKLIVKTGDTFTISNTTYTIAIYGDVNKDGRINSTDALSILRGKVQLEELDEIQKKAGDTKNRGKNANLINSNDALRILQFITGTVDTIVEDIEEMPVEPVNQFYYNQLNAYEKAIYDAMIESKDKITSGTYEITLNSAEFITLKNQFEREKSLDNVLYTFFYSNPDMFYIGTIGVRYNSKKVIICPLENQTYFSDEYTTQDEVLNAQEQIERIKNEALNSITATTDYGKVLQVHDWLVKHNEYELSGLNIHNIYGALVNARSACDGYAKSMKYLLNALNVDCEIIEGAASSSLNSDSWEPHAWNAVKIDNTWYYLDATYDDPLFITMPKDKNFVRYDYFLKSEETFSPTHSTTTYHLPSILQTDLKYPTISSKNY